MSKTSSHLPLVLCLMGPTAVGKTLLAVELVQRFPCDIVSVDSAMVYRGMDIGTAKPASDVLRVAPHRLIDILPPNVAYSAGQFRVDALHEMQDIIAKGRIPLLVGGTMLYFRVLQHGLADLPTANASLRAALQQRALCEGWVALHAELEKVDSEAAKRIHSHDGQRIQRALEVYQLTGKPITAWQHDATDPLATYRIHHLALMPNDRAALHARIATRFQDMLQHGFVEEVAYLYECFDLSPDLPSMRSVGYREIGAYLAGEMTSEEMKEKAIAATRQLAKRQITWLRSWPDVISIEAESPHVMDEVVKWLES